MIAATARLICARRALATEQGSPLIHDPYAHLFIDEASQKRALETDAPVHGVLLRNRFYQDFLRQSAPEQVLHLGSGLDTHYQRHKPLQEISYFEIDLPEMITFKTEILKKAKLPIPHFIARKIETIADVKEILGKTDPHLKTTLIAEGLFMYLDVKLVKQLLQEISVYFKTPPQIAFDFLDAKVENHPHHVEQRKIIEGKGEIFCWYANESEISELMKILNYKNFEFWDRDRMAMHYTGKAFPGQPFGSLVCISQVFNTSISMSK